jgi:hypothetical protein
MNEASEKFAGPEEFLAAIRYRDVECPDAGAVSVFDYISAGAMGEFCVHRSTPTKALSAVIRTSLEHSDAVFPKLTSNDYAAIARHLVATAGTEEQFDAQLQKADLASAFVDAVEQSTDWQRHHELDRKLHRSVERFSHSFNSVFREIGPNRSTILDVTRRAEIVREFETPAIAQLRTPLLDLKYWQSVTLRSAETLRHIDEIHRNARMGLERWNGLAGQFASQSRLASSLLSRQSDLVQMVDRLQQIEPLVVPIVNLSSAFADLSAQLRIAQPLSDGVLTRADSSLAESRRRTLNTSDFFVHSVRPYIPAPLESVLPAQVAAQDEEIQTACDEGEIILHEQTSLLIAAGNSIVENVRSVVGDVIDQRLGKYATLFARLDLLAKPRVFLDFLKEFSVIARRDYWRSLWTDPGNKWQPRPECHAQAMLGMFLHGKWSGLAFVGPEIANGDGFVDLLVNFLACDYIVELKMIGAGWPVSHAESGLPQLEHYMANYQTQEAYLVVFDGRKTATGRQLPEKHDTEHGTIHVVVVPVYFDAPSAH